MATEALADIAAALSQLFDLNLARQWNRTAEFASRLRIVNGAGKNAAWDFQFSGTNVTSNYAEGSDVQTTDFNFNPNVPAILSWAHYRQSFAVTDTDLEAAASSTYGTPDALKDLFGERIQNALAKIGLDMNVDLFNGTGSTVVSTGGGPVTVPTLVGIFGGSLEQSGSYAGVSRSTYAELAGNVLGAGGVLRPLTNDLLYQLEQNIFIASNQKPDMIICSAGVARKYAGFFEPEHRVVMGSQESPVYSRGSTTLFWNGMPIIRDRNCPPGHLAMLNSAEIELKQLPNRALAAYQSQQAQLQSSNGQTAQALQLMAQISPLARTGDASKIMVALKAALCVKRPNANGYITDILET